MCPLADKSRLLLANTQLDTTMAPLAYAGTAKMARLAISCANDLVRLTTAALAAP